LLAELVVHFTGDAPTLVFLGKHHAGQQLRARTFGLCHFALCEVEMRADNADDRPAWLAAHRESA
jgi:hypothetical protein